MNYTVEILNELEIDSTLISLISGDVEIPYIGEDFQSPETYWHPHPPVLIPMFAGYGFSYYGICQHWFIDRKTTFVQFEAEWGFMLEYARNAQQIFAQMILDMVMLKDGLDTKILTFAEDVNFDNPQSVDVFAEKYGDLTEHYSKLEPLSHDTPLTFVNQIDEYNGDFPSSERLFNIFSLYKASSYEIARNEYLTTLSRIPEWLNETINKRELFDKFIGDDNLVGAWLTLNSNSLTLPDIAEGLELLMRKSANPTFNLIAENWIRGWKNSSFFK